MCLGISGRTGTWLVTVVFLTLPVRAQLESEPFQNSLDQALSLAVDGEYERAAEVFESLAKLRGEDPRVHYYLGVCRYFQDRIESAKTSLRRAVELEAPFPEAYAWLARTLLDSPEVDIKEVREVLDSGLERFPRNRPLLELRRRTDAEIEPED